MLKENPYEIEEPPGRVIEEKPYGNFVMSGSVVLPEDRHARYALLKPLAPHIVAAYRRGGVEVASVGELSPEKERIAIAGMMDATHIITAYEDTPDREFAGALAYSIYTRENHPELFTELSLDTYTGNVGILQRRRVRKKLRAIDAIFLTQEMIVSKKRRGNGVSHAMRDLAFRDLEGKNVAVVGEVQSKSPIENRLKLPGITYWAGEILIPQSLKTPKKKEVKDHRVVGHILGTAYVNHHYPEQAATIDTNGALTSSVFEAYPKKPSEPTTPGIRQALDNIMAHQSTHPEGVSSGLAVTLVQV